jgi:mRNA-degrading endonuclease toxin of MazEF toxin-antitoxin module
VSKRTYYPDRADLIELTFNPAAGREIDKRRPAIVLSPVA